VSSLMRDHLLCNFDQVNLQFWTCLRAAPAV